MNTPGAGAQQRPDHTENTTENTIENAIENQGGTCAEGTPRS
ncbi:hypothetical protein [Streptomyces alfalfae]|nr:hypothetical protein [Streptomyces alfalfae]